MLVHADRRSLHATPILMPARLATSPTGPSSQDRVNSADPTRQWPVLVPIVGGAGGLLIGLGIMAIPGLVAALGWLVRPHLVR
jgi:hypothetical protein